MKAYMQISPSMKDQWSGKTFLIAFVVKCADPSRSSRKLTAFSTIIYPRSQ